MASKTANVIARVEPDIKKEAEDILEALGISASNAINMLYRQIVLKKGLPFELTLTTGPKTIDEMSEEEFNSMLNKGLSDAETGNGVTLSEAIEALKKRV